jgi:hypothetical protein
VDAEAASSLSGGASADDWLTVRRPLFRGRAPPSQLIADAR